MIDHFNSFHWHDAELLWFKIDRTNIDGSNEVMTRIRWPDESEDTFTFNGCFKLKIDLNMNCEGPENIRSAFCNQEHEELSTVIASWKSIGVSSKSLDLYYFYINTNTTNSVFEVFARSFAVT